jgi:hypothetical protein
MKKKKEKNSGEPPPAQNKETVAAETDVSNDNYMNELREPRWSVVSFEECAAKNLTYEEAARKLAEMEKQGVSGLCIVTDEAAKRIADFKN